MLITHGRLGEELLRCAEAIVGKQPDVRILGLDVSEGPGPYEQKIAAALAEMRNPDGVIVLADMMGGTPCNAALRQCREPEWPFEVVTGVNLPMLISVLSKRNSLKLEALAKKVTEDAPRNITRPIEKLRQALRREGHK